MLPPLSLVVVGTCHPNPLGKSLSWIHFPTSNCSTESFTKCIDIDDQKWFDKYIPSRFVISFVISNDEPGENEDEGGHKFYEKHIPVDSKLRTSIIIKWFRIGFDGKFPWTLNWCRWMVSFGVIGRFSIESIKGVVVSHCCHPGEHNSK